VRVNVHDLRRRSTEHVDGDADHVESELARRWPEICEEVDPDEEGLPELLEHLESRLDGYSFELEPAELDVKKNQPPPNFPLLNAEDRRETDLIASRRQLEMKQGLAFNAIAAAGGEKYGMHSPEVWRASKERYVGQEMARSHRGQTTTAFTDPPTIVSYAKAGALDPRRTAGGVGPLATKMHEDFHAALDRAAILHGGDDPGGAQERILAHLWEAIPEPYRRKVSELDRTLTGLKSDHNESIARLINYANDGGERDAYHARMGHDEYQRRALSTTFKRALKAVRARARSLTPEDIAAPPRLGKSERPAAFDAETERIAERRGTPEARAPHDFRAATWTHPNGHPRCALCGDEERAGGRCPGADHDGLEKVSLTPESTATRMRPHEPSEWEGYDRVETYPAGAGPDGRPMWQHVFYDRKNGPHYQSIMHVLSDRDHPLDGTLYASAASGIHDVADPDPYGRATNLPWQSGTYAKQGEVASAVPGAGYGGILYRNMARIHGRLASDNSTSAGADALWKKLVADPEFRGALSPAGDSGQVHWLEYPGQKPQPSRVWEGDGRALGKLVREPAPPYQFEAKKFSIKSPDDYMEVRATHPDSGSVGVRGLHLDHANKRIYQQESFRGGVNHFDYSHPDAGPMALKHAEKLTGYTFAGSLPWDHPSEIGRRSKSEGELEGSPNGDLAADMLGHRPLASAAFAAASFLVGGGEPAADAVRAALLRHGGDLEAAALASYGLEVTDENRRAIRGVGRLSKAEYEGAAIGRAFPLLPEAKAAADHVNAAAADGGVRAVQLGGRHSGGAMVASHDRHTVLIKPGSGKQSPAAGAREESASQSRREVAFYRVAEAVGLGEYVPRADLISVDGREAAAIEMLDPTWKNASKVAEEHRARLLAALDRYRQHGVLHRWAALDFLAGNPDRHDQNVMVSSAGEFRLIDHGSALAGPDFDPAHDSCSFVPWYLRAWAGKDWAQLKPDERLAKMPVTGADLDAELLEWLRSIDGARVSSILAECGVSPGPTQGRLTLLRGLPANASEGLDRLWVEV
jgi:hypothetical protein